MKKVFLSIVLFSLTSPLLANCGNGNGDGNGCSDNNGGGTPGQTGPQGPQGPSGSNGTNGTNGLNANDSGPKRALQGELDIRLWDTKYTSLYAFNSYGFDDSPKHDGIMDGRNSTYGIKFVIKLRKSYEETLLEKQAAQIKSLEAILSRMDH